MSTRTYQGQFKTNITATDTSIKSSTGNGPKYTLLGILVALASSTPTLKVADSGGTVANTFTPVAGAYYPMPCDITGTLTATISGTVDCTIFYAQK